MDAVVERATVLMTKDECKAASGGYEWPSRQVTELRKLGFHRATLDKNGQVRLERAHYEAVCRGTAERERPKVKPVAQVGRPQVKAAAAGERPRPKVKQAVPA